LPGVYVAADIFANAQSVRGQMGDDKFFALLNQAAAEDDEWGTLEQGWTAESFAAAVQAPPGHESRSRLVGDLVEHLFPAYRGVATARDEAYVPLDQVLSVLSRHAKTLGYDALILFLDELILWLASHAADLRFLQQEGQKLAKLVESQTPDRPVPVVSFVARQRDLRELVGDSVTGAEQLNFSDALKHWEGRFHTIRLDDRNLPAIAEKRVLRPREGCKDQIDLDFVEGGFAPDALALALACEVVSAEGGAGPDLQAAAVRLERFHQNPPLLFHKAQVTEGARGALDPAVEEAVLNDRNRVVGVVVNAIDDELKGAEQVRHRWTLEAIRPLGALLRAARDAGRLVVLAGDHGHVWHHPEALYRKAGGAGERWRPVEGAAQPGEIVFEGPRVRDGQGHARVIVPWDERLRYGTAKNGYHGGVTPQEMLAPLVLLTAPAGRPRSCWNAAWPGCPRAHPSSPSPCAPTAGPGARTIRPRRTA
jgi:hypothetical protein